MRNNIIVKLSAIAVAFCCLWSCKIPALTTKTENKTTPPAYYNSTDTVNAANIQWRSYFNDPQLIAIIDTALKNNQELNIALQEIEMVKNEVYARKGEYRPFVQGIGAMGLEKSGEYTRNGAVDESLEIKPGVAFPKPLPDFMFGLSASWELDVWKKLRNAKKAAMMEYLATIEGRNFMVTNLVSEIAASYYELMALDNLQDILLQNIEIQTNALKVIRFEKEAAKVSQLAVNRFDAQLLHTQNLQYEIKQRITETENRIHFLAGTFPQQIQRNPASFALVMPDLVKTGIPSQLLVNRPDLRQAELQLAATKLNVQVAKANFYPTFRITAAAGIQAFNPVYLVNPVSILYNLAGDLMVPLINKNAIEANYQNANARQIQAIYHYERSILKAHIEVMNQLSKMENYSTSYATKAREVDILSQSIGISNNLYRSARADYMEVLLTQREALESRIELTEIQLTQILAKVNLYKALGGGWN